MTPKEKLYANLIGALHITSRSMARTMVKPSPIGKPKEDLRQFVLDKTGVRPILNDSRYYVDAWDKWLKAIEIDWTNMNKYLKDRFDCDNFADSFNARMAEYYGWNTAGRLSIALHDPDTDEIIGHHRASLIIALEGPILVAYAYDPMIGMEDKYDKVDSAIIRIKNWVYKPSYITFN